MVRRPIDANGADFFSIPLEESQAVIHSEAQLIPAQPMNGSRNWLKLMLLASGVAGGLSSGALLWLFSIPPAPNCDQTSLLTSDMERLYCAQEAARSGELPKLLASIKMLGEWTPEHPLYRESQRLMGEWSQSVLTAADRKVEQSDINGAIELASQIPKASPTYKETQKSIASWRKQWRQAEAIYTNAQKAMQKQNWSLAAEKIADLRLLGDSYWRLQQANALTQQLQEEQRARKALAQARQVARSGKVQDLGTALTMMSEIRTNTYTWADLKPDLKKWSQTLLTFGFQQWQAGKVDQAIAVAQKASLNPDLADEAEHLKWLSQARRLALASSTNWKATPAQMLQLMTATTIASYIPAESRFYQPAQTSLKQWRAQFEDVSHLQIAQLAANLNHPFTLEFAMDQARQVASNRPRRLQAQTLAAHWRVELERIQDQPLIANARKLADKETIASLQSAMNQARQVKQGRALYPQAQAMIAGWNRQIQVLEDQPILRAAHVKADQGLRDEAIQVASRIRPGRPLYLEAQGAIAGWLTEISQARLARQRAFTPPGSAISSPAQPVPTNATPEPEIQPPPAIETPPSEPVAPLESTTSPLPESIPTFTPPVEPMPTVPTAPAPAAETTPQTAPLSPAPVSEPPAPPAASPPAPPAASPPAPPAASPSAAPGESTPSYVVPTLPDGQSKAPAGNGGLAQSAPETLSAPP